jgi:small subunit ribosomal protein S3
MSVVKHFVDESIKKTEIDEFLQSELENAGYGGVDISKTPLGTHIVVHAMRPGVVIGRGGETIKDLANVLEGKFGLPSPQISVAEIEIPELNAHVIASRVASAMRRGVHFRRSGYWALNQVMEAGALGVEIVISGKLRGQRAKYEKFRTGYLPKSGEPPLRYMKRAELHVQLKPGIFGIKVRLMPPQSDFPDKVKILEPQPKEVASDEASKEELEAVGETEAGVEKTEKAESQDEGEDTADEDGEAEKKEAAE